MNNEYNIFINRLNNVLKGTGFYLDFYSSEVALVDTITSDDVFYFDANIDSYEQFKKILKDEADIQTSDDYHYEGFGDMCIKLDKLLNRKAKIKRVLKKLNNE